MQSLILSLESGESEFSGHEKHKVLPMEEYFPDEHRKQADFEVAPVVTEYLPLGQAEHTELPNVSLYIPASQGVHCSPFLPVNPLSHSQLISAMLPEGEVVAVGHVEHGAVPALLLYFPAAHSEQNPPFCPV